MGPLGNLALALRMCLEVDTIGDTGREHTARVMLVLVALQKATSALRFIEENEISVSELRNLLPLIWDDLNRATYYLHGLKNSPKSTQTFLYN
jgi:hypothetical protein